MPNMLDEILRDIRDRQAGMELQRSGSVMANPPLNERSFLSDMIASIFGRSPLGFLGGGAPIAGHITEAGWKAMSPEASTMTKALFKAFPALERAVQATPREVNPFVANIDRPNVAGQLAYINKLLDRLTVIPTEAKTPVTPGHEFLHHVNVDRVAATNPADAASFLALADVLPMNRQGSLAAQINKLISSGGMPNAFSVPYTAAEWKAMSPELRAGATSALASPASKVPRSELPMTPFASHYNQYKPEPIVDYLSRTIMDEALSHLGESAIAAKTYPGTYGGGAQDWASSLSNMSSKGGGGGGNLAQLLEDMQRTQNAPKLAELLGLPLGGQ